MNTRKRVEEQRGRGGGASRAGRATLEAGKPLWVDFEDRGATGFMGWPDHVAAAGKPGK